MTDYISREAATRAVCEVLQSPFHQMALQAMAGMVQADCRKKIEALPAADAIEELQTIAKHYEGMAWKDKDEPRTHADRIRAMSDEELAEFMAHYDSYTQTGKELAKARWLDWLRQEVEEGE